MKKYMLITYAEFKVVELKACFSARPYSRGRVAALRRRRRRHHDEFVCS